MGHDILFIIYIDTHTRTTLNMADVHYSAFEAFQLLAVCAAE